tara:strand:- start:1589 stop:1771 length:183 start_codon:yes stop_codon:yes gene_type:complete
MLLLSNQLFKNPEVENVFTPPDERKNESGVLPFIYEIDILPVKVLELHYIPDAVVYFKIY